MGKMKDRDRLHYLLIDFFALPAETGTAELSQKALPVGDSLAMVQLIGELQATFGVEFDIDEIQKLRSYDEIRNCLADKGATLDS
jgi:acyl carrier protein